MMLRIHLSGILINSIREAEFLVEILNLKYLLCLHCLYISNIFVSQ